jgi:hypothetical protein
MKADKRNALPDSSFAMPGKRKYPIDTKARAKNALSRVAQSNTEGSPSTVRPRVLAKYPSLKQQGPSEQGRTMRQRGKGKKKGHAKQRLRRWA